MIIHGRKSGTPHTNIEDEGESDTALRPSSKSMGFSNGFDKTWPGCSPEFTAKESWVDLDFQ
jgi:hypothetical protein